MEYEDDSTYNPREYPYLPLKIVKSWEDKAKSLGVSEVARSRRGFLTAYKKAGGNHRRLSDEWRIKRDGFIARHMAQVENNDESLLTEDGSPTRRLLALIMWAFSPIKIRPNIKRRNSDRDIRALERRGDDDYTQARLLREKVRSGLLTEDRLITAARLGYEPARLASGESVNSSEREAIIWTIGSDRLIALSVLTSRSMVSLACKWAKSVLPIWESRYPDDMRPRKAIEAALYWINFPTRRSELAAEREAHYANRVASATIDRTIASAARSAASAAFAAYLSTNREETSVHTSYTAFDAAYAISREYESVERNAAFDAQRLDVIQALITPD